MDVMPTIKPISGLIFMLSASVTPCLVAIARQQDFEVLLKSLSLLPPSRWRIERFGRIPKALQRGFIVLGFGSTLDESEQLAVDNVGLCGDHAVWVVLVRLQRAVLEELG